MPKLVLIEGLPKYENVNEAKAITLALEIMKKEIDGRRARHLKIIPHTAETKRDFMRWLEKDTDFLHISAHGESKKGQTILNITRNATITPDEIVDLDIKARVIFINACQQSRKDMAYAFLDSRNAKKRYFIAPHKDVPFDEAFIIALYFYRKAFLNKSKNLSKALNYVYHLKDIKTNYFLWE